MFGSNSKKDYKKVSLDDFSDDSSDEGGFVNSPNNGLSNRNNGNYGGDNFGGLSRQQQLMEQQDQGLEMLAQSAQRLGDLSMAISDELNQQNQMLEDIDNDLEEAGDNLDFVTKQTKQFIELSGGTQNFMLILALIVIAIILFLLVLYV